MDQVVSFPTSGSVYSDGILIAFSNREGKFVKIVWTCGLLACRDFVDSSSVAGNLLQYIKQGHLSPKHAFFMEKYGIFEKKQ